MTQATKEFDPLPKGRLSPSAKESLLSCGEKWFKANVLHLTQDPAPVLIRGSVVHDALQFAAREQLAGHKRPGIKRMVEWLVDDLKATIDGEQVRAGIEIDWAFHDETPENMQYEASRGLTAYEQQIGHTLVPLEVEELCRFTPPDRDYDITCKKDIVTVDGFLRDYKVKSSKMDPLEAAMSDQLRLYQIDELMKGRKLNGLALDGIILTAEVQIQPVEVQPFTQEQLEACLIGFDRAVRQIRLGALTQCNNFRTCSYCGFMRQCQVDIYPLYRDGKVAKARERLEKKAAAAKEKKEKGKKGKGGK